MYKYKQRRKTDGISVVVVLAFLVLLLVGLVMIINSHYDGLTWLLNRRQFNKMLAYLKKRRLEYGIITKLLSLKKASRPRPRMLQSPN